MKKDKNLILVSRGQRMMQFIAGVVGGIALIVLLPVHGLAQTERFVAPDGSDSGNCTVDACATIGHALDESSDGDIIHLAPGDYTESVTIEKSVDIRGAGQGSTFIQSHALPEVANQRVITMPAMLPWPATAVSLSNLTIRHGSAFGPSNQGGGIYNDGNQLHLTDVSIVSNQAQFGGGIYSVNNHDSSLTGVTFFNNHAFGGTTGGNGGGLYLDNSSPSLQSVVFLANSAAGESVLRGSGGGVYMTSNSSPSLALVVFSNNVAEIRGGGLYVREMSFPTLLNCHFSGNQATGGDSITGIGGAIYSNGGALDVVNTRFVGNSSSGTWSSGGAVYASGSDLMPSRFVNTLFTENTAYRGAGLRLNSAEVQVVSSTFSDNVATGSGAAIYREDSDLVLASSISWENGGAGGGISSTGSGSFSIGYSLVQDGCPATAGCFNVIADDPQFVDMEAGNYQLQSHSPAISTGDPNADPASYPATTNGTAIDLLGNRRFRNDRIDMGPFEFQGTPEPAPGVPDLISPADGTDLVGLPVAFDWAPVSGANSYRVQVAPASGDFADPVLDQISTGTDFNGVGLDTLTEYQWRVLARNDEVEGQWSEVWHFTTDEGITPDANNVLYVRRFAPGNESGNSWANAIPELADALRWAWLRRKDGLWDEDNPLQIWVGAIGGTVTYLPQYRADDIGGPAGPNNGNAFVMVENVQIYGGFGAFETSPDQRDLQKNQTTLSGGSGYYHVVVSAGAAGVSRLDGFTITGGKAVHPQMTGYEVSGHFIYGDFGGAIYNTSGSPVLANLVITDNEANFGGGGIYTENGSPQLINVNITNNYVNGGYGGALHNESGSPLLRNVLIAENQAPGGGGGGMANRNDSHPSLVNVTFASNLSMLGGALYNEDSSSEISNSIFWSNEGFIGTELFNDMDSSVTMTHSIYVGGKDGVYGGGGFSVTASHTADPMFVDTDAGDYAVQGGSVAVQGGSNIPYLNAGGHISNDVDLAGNPRIVGGTIDIGAFELQDVVVEDGIFADRFQND